MIYLDWNATAPVAEAARQAWLDAQAQAWGNPGAVHAFGQQARHALDQARASIARGLGGAAHEWIVTSGGSEANALAIASAVSVGGCAAHTTVEHSSIVRNLEARFAEPVRISVDSQGCVEVASLQAALRRQPALVCIQFANNETGVRQDIPALAAIIRREAPQTWFHVDGAQGPGKVAIDVRSLGCDSFSVAGHKFGAPKGVGLLWLRSGRSIVPLIHGGRQQQDRRSGTEDAALVCALAAALTVRLVNVEAEAMRQGEILTASYDAIVAQRPAARWLGREAERLPNVLSLALPGAKNDALVTRLDLAGFAVSRGAACQASKDGPSPVIAALGVDDATALGTLRISIGWTTTAAELEAFVAAYLNCT